VSNEQHVPRRLQKRTVILAAAATIMPASGLLVLRQQGAETPAETASQPAVIHENEVLAHERPEFGLDNDLVEPSDLPVVETSQEINLQMQPEPTIILLAPTTTRLAETTTTAAASTSTTFPSPTTTTIKTTTTTTPVPTAPNPPVMPEATMPTEATTLYTEVECLAETVVVKKNMTLIELAEACGRTLSELVEVNPQIDDANLIITGDILNLPPVD
jgi:LysM repeat protein